MSAHRELAIGCVAISFAAIFFRLAGAVDPLTASALRLAIAALVLAPAIARARVGGRLDRRVLRADRLILPKSMRILADTKFTAPSESLIPLMK